MLAAQKGKAVLHQKKFLLLDMNSTFMFGEDRFGEDEDYSKYYKSIGGDLPKNTINKLVSDIYNYLSVLYPDEKYRHNFPTMEEAINIISNHELSDREIKIVINTFAFHEHGYIPEEYINVLYKLKSKFTLAAVIDIWSPKQMWLNTFEELKINNLFSAASFSSDHGMVKPSPKPFQLVMSQLGAPKEECLVIGDSRRDLGGATAAGIDCVLVGEECDSKALCCYKNLLRFYEELKNS